GRPADGGDPTAGGSRRRRPTRGPAGARPGRDTPRRDRLRPGRGEILGIAGLTGSGREELATAMVGAAPSAVRLENGNGRAVDNPTPQQAKGLGVVLVLPNRASGAAVKEF